MWYHFTNKLIIGVGGWKTPLFRGMDRNVLFFFKLLSSDAVKMYGKVSIESYSIARNQK